MIDTVSCSAANAVRADRARGGMFLSVFGGLWLVLWAHRAFVDRPAVLGGVIALAVAVLGIVWLRYRRFRRSAVAIADEKKKAEQIFHIVNAGQWLVIFVAGNVLSNIGRSDWVIPAAIFIIGLHFLPLGKLFRIQSHYLTGAALMVLSLAYPEFSAAGAADPVGCFGAGVILLTGALWTVTVNAALPSDGPENSR